MMEFLRKLINRLLNSMRIKPNHRKFVRLSGHNPLKYKVVNGESVELSFTRNISGGGVLFYCKEDLSEGSIIELNLNLPGYPRPIDAVAKVIRSRRLKKVEGFDIAAEFIKVDEDARSFIDNKVNAETKKGKKTGNIEKG